MNTVDRRNFLAQSAALAGGSLLPFSNSARAEPPTETKKIRLIIDETICLAPQFLSAEFLRLEGFTEVEYVRQNYGEFPNAGSSIAASKAD